MDAILRLGALELTPYGLRVALGAALWCALAALAARHFCVRADAARLMIPCALALGFLCARVVFVLGSLPYYLEEIAQPDKMLLVWHGGYAMTGALLGVALACALAGKLAHTDWRALADCASIGAPAFVLCERLAERFTGLGLGRGIRDAALRGNAFFATVSADGYYFHTVYRYEAVAALLLMLLGLWLLARPRARAGQAARLMAALFCASQTLLESLRGDGHMLYGFVRVQQAICFAALIALAISRATAVARSRGRMVGLALACGAVASAALCVWMEFRVDLNRSLWLDYGLMAAGLTALATVAVLPREATRRGQPQIS